MNGDNSEMECKMLGVGSVSDDTNMEIDLPYMEQCLLTYLVSPSPHANLKKKNLQYFYFILGPF